MFSTARFKSIFASTTALSLLGLISLICFGPILFLVWISLEIPADQIHHWEFLSNSLVPTLLKNTFVLISLLSLTTSSLGVLLAYLIVFCNLPGKKVFDYLFIIPISLPLYLLAFIYVGMFEFSSPLMTSFRNLGIPLHDWIKMRSTGGVVFVFTLALYPYVYLLAKSAFLKSGDKMGMVARSLGLTPLQTFFRLILPYSAPWILTGTSLAIMEALADFGGVSVFNYDTFTTAIYSAWVGLFSISSAARLSCFLILFALLLYLGEIKFSQKTRFTSMGKSLKHNQFHRLSLTGQMLSLALAVAVVFFSLVLPTLQLFVWFSQYFSREWSTSYWTLLYQTFLTSLVAAFITALISLLIISLRKLRPGKMADSLTIAAMLGYALPGSLIAVAVFVSLQVVFQNTSFNWLGQGSFLFLITGYMIRYLSVSYRTQQNTYQSIPKSYDLVAKSLGSSFIRTQRKVFLPLLTPAFLTSFILLFLEILKEMPMTLMLRPLGFNTLTVKIYELTAEGEWERASIAGLFILLSGMVGSYILLKFGQKQNA